MISVIVPVYNVEKYLNRCIDSILKQSYNDFELILIDDGSTDKSGKICDKYKFDFRVNVIHQKNKGVSAARNAGIEVSKGEYLLFIDSDDWLDSNTFEKIICCGQEADLIMFGAMSAKEIESQQYHFVKYIYWKDKKRAFEVKDKYHEIFDKNATLWNKMIRRSVIGNERFNEFMTYGEDCDFLCRILVNVKKAIIVPDEFYYYFINRPGNVVSSEIDIRSIELLNNSKKIYDFLAPRGYQSSGVRRILMTVNEVLTKVPLTKEDIKNNKRYIKEARKTLFYPRFMDIISFELDKKIDRSIRKIYLRIMVNPFHMYYRLWRNKKK